MKRILVTRFSAMGDVAISVSAIHNVLENNPEIEIVLLTKTSFWPLFGEHSRLLFHTVDLKGKHKGFLGLKRLYRELKQYKIAAYADIHDVLRTKVLRGFYSLSKKSVAVIKKDRKIKEDIVSKKLPITQQRHSLGRYLDVFEKLNLTVNQSYSFQMELSDSNLISQFVGTFDSNANIYGIAPFAAHGSKEWGLDNIKELIHLILQQSNAKVLLFGGGEYETKCLKELADKDENIYSVAGKYSLLEELQLMKKCTSIIAMDSANMHLADLVGVQVNSIWISTHPCFGFYPIHNLENCIFASQTEFLDGPLSVYGKLKSSSDTLLIEQVRSLLTPELVFSIAFD